MLQALGNIQYLEHGLGAFDTNIQTKYSAKETVQALNQTRCKLQVASHVFGYGIQALNMRNWDKYSATETCKGTGSNWLQPSGNISCSGYGMTEFITRNQGEYSAPKACTRTSTGPNRLKASGNSTHLLHVAWENRLIYLFRSTLMTLFYNAFIFRFYKTIMATVPLRA
jgi:hypothetical protein